jgi:hypothetical protein
MTQRLTRILRPDGALLAALLLLALMLTLPPAEAAAQAYQPDPA